MRLYIQHRISITILLFTLLIAGCTEDKYKDWQLLNEKWLTNNLKNDSIKQTSSGLQYKVIYQGDPNMRKPSASSLVIVDYKGELIDGTVFQEAKAVQIELSSNSLRQGWKEGLPLMNGGGTYVLYIPSDLAYGKDGLKPGIPPYSTLKFTITLIDSQH
jgi:FKBP-type peptidyl-prolyl cis-trans isomerase FklB